MTTDDIIAVTTLGKVRIFNSNLQTCTHEIQTEGDDSLFAIDVKPTKNECFAVAGQNKTIKLYDIGTLKPVTKFEQVFESHTNRIFALKFDPFQPNLLYSGGWDSYIVVNDIRQREKVGDIFGPKICGESIDVNDTQLLVGSYSLDHYLSIYDSRKWEKICDVPWGDVLGTDPSNKGMVYSCRFWNTKSHVNSYIVAGSSKSNDLKIFNQRVGQLNYTDINHVYGMSGGVLSLDCDKGGNGIVYGTQAGEITVLNAVAFRDDE